MALVTYSFLSIQLSIPCDLSKLSSWLDGHTFCVNYILFNKLWMNAPTDLAIIIILFCSMQLTTCLLCHLCDNLDGDYCSDGSLCVGVACVKREAFIDGVVRVQKMCLLNEKAVILEQCKDTVLWKSTYGIECICQTELCNFAHNHISNYLFTFLAISAIFILSCTLLV